MYKCVHNNCEQQWRPTNNVKTPKVYKKHQFQCVHETTQQTKVCVVTTVEEKVSVDVFWLHKVKWKCVLDNWRDELHQFNGCFPWWTWISWFPSGPPPPAPRENIWELMGAGFLCNSCHSCHPTISVKALKGTQSIFNQWSGLILSSSTTGFLERALLHLCRWHEMIRYNTSSLTVKLSY